MELRRRSGTEKLELKLRFYSDEKIFTLSGTRDETIHYDSGQITNTDLMKFPEGTALQMPKDVSRGDFLLWTHQAIVVRKGSVRQGRERGIRRKLLYSFWAIRDW